MKGHQWLQSVGHKKSFCYFSYVTISNNNNLPHLFYDCLVPVEADEEGSKFFVVEFAVVLL